MENGHHDMEDFMDVFPQIIDDLTYVGKNREISFFYKWYEEVLRYNLMGGKMTRGVMVANSFAVLADSKDLTKENMKLAHILGWCVELIQSYFLVSDDLMDNSKTRRGRLCWYRTNGLGKKAFNDSCLLEKGAFNLVRKHLQDQPYYIQIVDLLNEVCFKTLQGQSMDLLTASNDNIQFDLFTKERYAAIAKYKTSYYSFCLSVGLAMYMAGITDKRLHNETEKVLLKIGYLFQIQDDYLDCFGDPELIGKVGTDIEEGKCSWVVVTALEIVNPQQRAVLEECYGSEDPDKVDRVKKLYHQLNIQQIYEETERSLSKSISHDMKDLSNPKILKLCTLFLNKIISRKS